MEGLIRNFKSVCAVAALAVLAGCGAGGGTDSQTGAQDFANKMQETAKNAPPLSEEKKAIMAKATGAGSTTGGGGNMEKRTNPMAAPGEKFGGPSDKGGGKSGVTPAGASTTGG